MSLNLKNISQIGLEIIGVITNKKVIDQDWKNKTSEIFKKAREPIAETELMIVSAVEKLFQTIK